MKTTDEATEARYHHHREVSDSEMSNVSRMERRKYHICVFDIADHFKKQTLGDANKDFVLLFIDSLNKKMQERQMDI